MDPYSYHEQFGKVTWAKETEAGNGSGCGKWTWNLERIVYSRKHQEHVHVMDMEFEKDSILT